MDALGAQLEVRGNRISITAAISRRSLDPGPTSALGVLDAAMENLGLLLKQGDVDGVSQLRLGDRGVTKLHLRSSFDEIFTYCKELDHILDVACFCRADKSDRHSISSGG